MKNMRKRSRRYRLAGAAFVAVLAIASGAFARNWDPTCSSNPTCAPQRHFGPTMTADGTHVVNTQASLDFTFNQPVDDDVVTQYNLHIPSGYRFAVGSVQASTLASCGALNDATVGSNAEHTGFANMIVDTTTTGPRITFGGEVFFLNWTPTGTETGLAKFCILLKTSSSVPSGASQTIVSELDLTRNADRSWDAAWNLKTAPGSATTPSRSIVDMPAWQNANVSVEELSFNFGSVTKGNYTTDPATGVKQKVPFTFSPFDAGAYTFDLTAYPCGTQVGDPVKCASSFGPVDATYQLSIGTSIVGSHPIPVIDKTQCSPAWNGKAAGCQEKPFHGKTWNDVVWSNVTGSEAVRGYLVSTGVPYESNRIHYDRVITNPSDANYSAAADPCAPDGTATKCTFRVDVAQILDTHGNHFNANLDTFSTSIIAIYMDGHRSDGRCDDGTPQGAIAPCGDGSVPQFTSPGYTYVMYMFTPKAWPLSFIEGGSAPVRQYFLDLENHVGEYVEWCANCRPYIKRYPLSGALIQGTSSPARGTVFQYDSTNTDGRKFGIQAYVDGTTLRGCREIFLQTIDTQTPNCSFSLASAF